MPRYADVALPLGVDREFTYLLPAPLQESAVVGARVLVPFGKKYLAGLIVGLPERSSVPGLKHVREVLDGVPLVSPELLRLCRWIGDYYFAPLGEVLKAANPGAFLRPSKRFVSLSSSFSEARFAELEARAPKRAHILRLLAARSRMTTTELQRATGIREINRILADLERSGDVTTDEILPASRSALVVREFIHLESLDRAQLAGVRRTTPSRNIRILKFLHALEWLKDQGNKEVPVAEMLKRSGASTTLLRKLADRGLFTTLRREVRREQDFGTEQQTLGIVLNESQRQACESITAAVDTGAARTFLLHGVTGSGKTQVYIEAIRQCVNTGKSAIVLVPEISLTPQIVRRFKSHFGDSVGVVHSRMPIPERREIWRLAQRGDCRIVIGPRSAIFAPLKNLGLIVVDEEHEASYKQFDSVPRYHARDVAVVRGSLTGAPVVLGSATPSVESYYNAINGKYTLLELAKRIDEVPMPQIAIVDMTSERKLAYAALKESLPIEGRAKLKAFQQPGISALLRSKIEDRLARKEGVILLQNRRGFAPFVECPECGYAESCTNCNVTLTYHLAQKHLRCHYCGLVRQPYLICPGCGGTSISLHGIGTQRVEEELRRLFPQARILRMDLDTTTRKGAHDKILRKFGNGEADILLGTQMVAKGLDFPHVTLVGVISADTQMLLPDFRAAERTFQILTQVAGRAGRSGLLGEVIIQTHQPSHLSLAHVIDHDYKGYFADELESRRELDYPPFSRLALIEAKGADEGKVRAAAEKVTASLKPVDGVLKVLGPAPAVLSRINNQYRWHTIVKDIKSRDPGGTHLRQVLQRAKKKFDSGNHGDVRLIIDVDPAGLM